jgi:hypothetical protein
MLHSLLYFVLRPDAITYQCNGKRHPLEAYANYMLKQSHPREEEMDFRKGFRIDQELE